jgi:hypothetical protein
VSTDNTDLEGKIVIVPAGGHTNGQDKTYMVHSYECYVIKGGEPRRIIPVQVTGAIHHALKHMELMPDVSYSPGSCGKPEPINYDQTRGMAQMPSSQVGPSQIWREQQVMPQPIMDTHLRVLMG